MTTNTDDATDGDANSDDGFEEYADLGATTSNAMDIAETSMDRVRELVRDETLADRIRQKSVHATGDLESSTSFASGADDDEPVRAGAQAVLDEQPIVTDITMAKAGITGRGHDCPVKRQSETVPNSPPRPE